MKPSLILLITLLCTNGSIAQYAIGGEYGLRVFPMQKHENYTYYDYSDGGNYPTEYTVTLTPAREHVANIFFEIPTRNQRRFLHFDLNFCTTSLDFKKMKSESWGEAGVNGSDGYYNTFTLRGTYTYSFVGVQIGTNHYHQLSSGNFSFIRGFLASLNFLAYQKPFTKNRSLPITVHQPFTRDLMPEHIPKIPPPKEVVLMILKTFLSISKSNCSLGYLTGKTITCSVLRLQLG